MGGDMSKNIVASSNMHAYFSRLQKDTDTCYSIADKARKRGLDPELEVEIPQALDIASRVEQLVGPEGIASKIRETTKEIGNRELVSLEIARQIVGGKTYKFNKPEDALDQAVRTGLAILTEGVLVAPLEGIAEVKLGSNKDGTNYVDLYFSGPIRSAGGTGQAMSVLIADVVRREMGIGKYKPTSGEIERYKEEIPLYKRAQHLQYTPSVDEIHNITKACPVCINGEGTEDVEVTGYRDLPRVGTNRLRGGACLVIAEGLCLKAPKLLKHVKKLKLKGWGFLDMFVNKSNGEDKENTEEIPAILPSTKYLDEVIAGRPVFSYPSRKGGFRLRYGRARTAGLASTAISPASMNILDGFIAVGTQLKTERPGKGTIGTPCSQLEGPIILLQNGDLVQVNDAKSVKKYNIKKIIDIGEILVPFGEFIENNALLPNSPYVYEWWIQDLQKSINCLPKHYTPFGIAESDEKTQRKINEDFDRELNLRQPSFLDAVEISTKYSVPLHPYYNLFWHDITADDVVLLAKHVKKYGEIVSDTSLVLPWDDKIKNILIELCALHKKRQEKIILDRYAYPLVRCLGLDIKDGSIIETDRFDLLETAKEGESTVSFVSRLTGLKIRERAPFRIGARMGRPEKADVRKMKPPPHVLFPLGTYGSNQRLFSKAAQKGEIEVEAGKRRCSKCGKVTHRISCICGGHTEPIEGRIEVHKINLSEELKLAKNNIKMRDLPETIKGVQGTISKHKTPEPLEKGLLRAKHKVPVFKDGTTRFDMTDAPLTHFKPKEIHVSIQMLKKLGYTEDYRGNPLEQDNQICELKVQDVVISKACAEYFVNVSRFIDDLLVKFYKLNRFFKIRRLEDLTGHLAVGLAPHTSAGSLARIIGFTDAQVCFAHPFYHAAKRRNCLSPDTNIPILNSEKPLLTNMQELYNNTISNEVVVDDFGTKQKNVDGISTFTLNHNNRKSEIRKIKSIIKVKAPKHLIEVKLKSGRNFISSPHHKVLVWSNGKVVTKKALELCKDDNFFASHKIDFPDKDVKEIDLLLEFLHISDKCEDIVVRGAVKVVKGCVKKFGGLKYAAQRLEINKKTFSNYIYRNSIPVSILLKLLGLCGKGLDAIPVDCMLGVKRDHTSIPRIIKVNKSFMRLLGYYISEGHSRYTKKNCYQVGFASSETEMRNDIIQCIKDIFGVHVYESKYGMFISSRLIHDFFVHILDIGANAKNKRIPSNFLALPKYKMRELLSAYFSGDGSVEKDRLHVTCSSVNRNLLEDIGLQLLRFGIFYRLRNEKRKAGGIVKRFYDMKGESPVFEQFYISIRSSYARRFCEKIGFSLKRKQCSLESAVSKERKPRLTTFGDFILDGIKEITPVKSSSEFLYDVEVEDLHNFPINNFIVSNNCDGDEDGLMLLMDALLNFSHAYIPDKRGGRMDLPLILTTRLDPSEVDKEAHNVDTLARYPIDFYEATLRHEHPKELEDVMDLVSSRIGTELQYEKFGFTHDTDDISEGPTMSSYKTLKTMMDKMNSQLDLAAKIRAVDEADVAYKVIERHFLPDILGNLRAFSKQSVRCPVCNITYRRIPISGKCRKCNGKLILTVHEKSVKKYLEISKKVAEKYHIPPYARQRIKLVEKSIDSLFMSDKIKKTKITDFF